VIIIFRKERGKIRIKLSYFLTSIIFLIAFIAYLVLSLQQYNVQISSLLNTVSNQNQTIQNQADAISQKEQTVSEQKQTIDTQQTAIIQQKQQITTLQGQVNQSTTNLQTTTTQLTNVTYYYDVAKNFEDRTDQGIDLSKAYQLLGQYDKVVSQVTSISGSYPTSTSATSNDTEIWSRAKNIYNWIGNNFKYCSDKALCVSGNCWDFQFYSPNELVSGENIVLCGDCDDHAQLFAGMMYASGVSHSKVRVECGSVPQGGHCWDSVYVNNQWYRVDTVCANPTDFKLFFGISISIPLLSFPTSYGSVGCFSYYSTTVWYTPEGYAGA
jgi:hypothetical protein